MRPALRRLFADYADAHRHPLNRLTHKIAIPMIVLHIIAMSDWITLLTIDGVRITSAFTGVAMAGAWYLFMSPKLGAILAPAMALAIPIGRALPVWSIVAIAVVGWVIQLVGHYRFEKNSPAFLKNVVQTLVGPAFFVALLTRDWPLRQESLR